MASWPSLSKVRELLALFLPKWLSEVLQKGLLRTLLVTVGIVIVLPPVTLLLATYWLGVMSGSQAPIVKALRTAMLDVIHHGLSTEEVAARSNVRLDYLQWFNVKLTPRRHWSEDLRLSLTPGQKARIDFRAVKLTADNPTCTVPEDDRDLFTVYIGDERVRTLKAESNIQVPIEKSWWSVHGPSLNEEDLLQRLSFKLTPEARELPCGEVNLDGAIQVFKDVYAVHGGGAE